MSRPTLLTPKVESKILQAIQAGATYEIAAKFAGITARSFYGWINRGKQAEERQDFEDIYFQFFQKVNMANAQGAITNLALVQKAASQDWKAAAWILTNRHGYNKEQQSSPVININVESANANLLIQQIEENQKKLEDLMPRPSFKHFQEDQDNDS